MNLLPGDLVLVTGASGFLGCRLVDFLIARGLRVRVLTSDYRHCSRVARHTVEMVKASLNEPTTLAPTIAGCRAVFHCAFAFGGSPTEMLKVNLSGTKALAEAAQQAGVERFVHISSVAAYGSPRDGRLNESSSFVSTNDAYSCTKLALEQMLAAQHKEHGLPVVMLQPSIVYGPFGTTWSTRLIEQLRNGPVALPRNGTGLCNAVFVDDVVSAILLAAEKDDIVGSKFLISGDQPVTWLEFYNSYAKMLGVPNVLPLSDSQYEAAVRRQRHAYSLPNLLHAAMARRSTFRSRLLQLPPQSWILSVGRKLLPKPIQAQVVARYDRFWQRPPETPLPLLPETSATLLLYSAKTEIQIDHARHRLGYQPAFDLKRGMALTAAWAHWGHLLK